MTDIYTQENGSKKKFLAPVLVILLCMVSLTAAGYAYSATVDNSGDDVIVDGVSLALYEDNGTTLVEHAMYNVTGVHIATHTVNGKAIYNAKGFDKTDTTALINYPDDFAKFAPGFYVQALKDEAGAGYNATVPVITDQDSYDAAIAANGMFALTETYVLKVDKQTTDDVNVMVNTKILSATNPAAVKAIFLMITSEDGSTFVAADVAAADDNYTAIATLDGAAGVTTYTVSAYVFLSDYYSATAPVAADYSDISFAVSFKATV